MSKGISLVLVDDHELLVDGLRGMFDSQPDITVVGSAGDSDSALTVIDRTRPDVVLLDVSIIGAPAATTVAAISKISPRTRTVVLSMQDDPRTIAQLVDLGICGYLLKSASWEELLAAVRMSGGLHDRLLLSISRRSLQGLKVSAPGSQHNGVLSQREIEILMFTSAGLGNVQIAKKCGLTEATVKRHLHNIFGKLGAVSRIDAVNRAKEQGILPPTLPR